ncbi:Reticulon-like protein [Heracleum sosnowskyi]|uniref:Reticulon-like protein n=1 Tax=Heracleum sosnowskyi TaxID=360622 RepID=A0AAD8N9E7_9APIA|nr:Reticulon-like protein [Heracleum sosnowskyi]
MTESLPKVDSEMEKTIKKLNEGVKYHHAEFKESKPLPMSAACKAKIFRIFGRDNKSLQKLFGYASDIILWRNKRITIGVLGFATAIWVLFELLEYHFLTLVCHVLILALAFVYLWSNASTLFKKSPPKIPEVRLPEDVVLSVAGALRIEINGVLAFLHDIAAGKDVKKFIVVIAGLWLFSIIGSCCDFLTLLYISFLLLHAVPVLYEKYEVKIDAFAEKAEAEIKKQYAVFDMKVLSKIPKGLYKGKKFI